MVHFGRASGGLSEPATRPIAKNSVSLFGHGIGHLFLAGMSAITTTGTVFESLRGSSGVGGRALAFAALLPVWYVEERNHERRREAGRLRRREERRTRCFVLQRPPRVREAL